MPYYTAVSDDETRFHLAGSAEEAPKQIDDKGYLIPCQTIRRMEHSQARSVNKLDFHFNMALTTVNIAKIIQLKVNITANKSQRQYIFDFRD
ncbi:hypothetical protein AGMMS50239_12820 [Bacteroidia bacterium]|nr:hypothetical protein AGMMS50239_12820 [Bacteroidia bacterium]